MPGVPATPEPERRPQNFREWVKAREHPVARGIYAGGMFLRHAQVPSVRFIHRPLYALHGAVKRFVGGFLAAAWYTPLFQSRLVANARGLRCWNGVPLVMGNLEIEVGENVVMYGQNVFAGRVASGDVPYLKIGDRVTIGYGMGISVGRRVEIGNNVLIATGVSFFGYPGHPIDPVARARGEMDLESQVGDIIIEDDVWLAQGVRVMAGVRIGRATIVGAGSVVTRDLPAGVIAAGVPARPVKTLAEAGVKGFSA